MDGIYFLYLLLGTYDSIHKKSIMINRSKKRNNYFYALHLFGICTAVLEYGYLMEGWPVCFPVGKDRMYVVCSGFGFVLLVIGFCFILLGRLYLNSYWGKDIYNYKNIDDYKLIKDHIYGACRHPIYFGQVCMCFGTAFVLNNYVFLFFATGMLIMNIYRAKREDQALKECFRDEWEKYKEEVSFFIPFM